MFEAAEYAVNLLKRELADGAGPLTAHNLELRSGLAPQCSGSAVAVNRNDAGKENVGFVDLFASEVGRIRSAPWRSQGR